VVYRTVSSGHHAYHCIVDLSDDVDCYQFPGQDFQDTPCIAVQAKNQYAPLFRKKMMLYKFKSQAAGDVIMLQLNGDQMLTLIGKEPAPQGIITVAQIPAAIAALEAAIVVHEAAQATRRANPELLVETDGDSVMLRHRAAPFIDLLRTSAQAGKDVVWGV